MHDTCLLNHTWNGWRRDASLTRLGGVITIVHADTEIFLGPRHRRQQAQTVKRDRALAVADRIERLACALARVQKLDDGRR
jgi:hypothetical protein